MPEQAAQIHSRCLAIIPAYNEEALVYQTVLAARKISEVDAVIVIDDGSQDETAARARAAGAVVIRRPKQRGKGAAIEAAAKSILEELDDSGNPLILLLDADLGSTATEAARLIEAVRGRRADMAIGMLPRRPDTSAGGFGFVVGLSSWGIHRCTGWKATQPLSGQRCLTLESLKSARPLARGFGLETAMTIDLLRKGFRVLEVETNLAHRVTGKDWSSQIHRGRQFRDVLLALMPRLLKRLRDSNKSPKSRNASPK